jgi:hypothetical protein
MEFSIAYTAEGGGSVRVPYAIDPYRELGVNSRATPGETKQAYGRRANLTRRQNRVMASLSYHMITSTAQGRYLKRSGKFEIRRIDQFVLAATGYTESLLERIKKREFSLSQADEHGRTSLYIAARSGFYDSTKALLEAGAPVNQKQKEGSTPLHGAAYYGQVYVVKLLLSYGADPTIKNSWGNTPADETSVSEIKQLVLDYKDDKIADIARSFIAKGLAIKMLSINYEGKEVARKIVRNYTTIPSMTKKSWEEKLCQWETSWHGTKFKYLESILTHGLLASGEKVDGHKITPPDGHIPLGKDCFGKLNWAAAIFISPSVLYASHAVYAERLMSGGKQWCVLVRARVKPHSYSEHSSTTLFKNEAIEGEPENSEYRIPSSDDDKIRRVESSRNVVVTSTVFIQTSFFEKITETKELDYLSLLGLFGDE